MAGRGQPQMTGPLLAEQVALLERATRGEPLADLLDLLCRMFEDQHPDCTCTVLLIEGDRLKHGAAPGMPASFTEAIDGERIGPSTGSCGTAAHLGKPVFVDDVATDPKWEPWRDLALALGYRSCWSVPVIDDTGTVLATFAAYGQQVRMPTDEERDLLGVAASLAALLIGQHRSRQRNEAMAVRLGRVNDELLEAGRAKDDFLSMTSHELRTPLTPMTGMLETLLVRWDDLGDDRRRELVAVVHRHATRMTRLVDDLLAMASVASDRLDRRPEDVALAPAVHEAVVSVFAEGRRIVNDVDEDVVVRVDRTHLQQMLINYLTNALKYAPNGPIRVTAAVDGDEVHVRVIDEGPGIAEAFLDRLFEPFAQIDSGDRRTARGTGLGLSVVRALARANEGRAWYEQRPLPGASFGVTLPRAGG